MTWTALWNDLTRLELRREQIQDSNAIVPQDDRKVHESISKLAKDTHPDLLVVERNGVLLAVKIVEERRLPSEGFHTTSSTHCWASYGGGGGAHIGAAV